jgi:hypothetical protein
LIEPTCVANKYSISIVVGKESLYTEALTETENVLRNAKAHREFWEGRLSWIENLRKQFEDVTTPSEDGELNATEDMYGNYEIISKAIGTASKAASVLKVVAETGTEKRDGVKPEYDIRTDRFEIAREAMETLEKGVLLRVARLRRGC